ncbi:MAG TPA: TonB family protein [Steroidobacteraceae bacterium]
MLASDKDRDTQNALGFSLASDIVELVVFTNDDVFLQTLREAVGGARRLWHVPSADKVSDLLLAGEVGILVLDVQALPEAANVFIAEIKRQFPDLVVVVAGNREAETSLASLISTGIVYRFIHKPMSPGRAKLFAEAAVKKYEEHRKRAPVPPGAARIFAVKRRLLIGTAIGVLVAGIVATWALLGGYREGEPPQAAVAVKSPSIESALPTRADAALAANRLTEPGGDNALDLYRQELARDPSDASARAGLAEVHERLLARAENALLEERLDEAATAIETARKAGVDGGRIAFLTAQLAKSRELFKGAMAQARPQSDSRAAEANAGGDGAGRSLSLASERMKAGRLIDPDRDNARYYVQEALRIDPNGNATQAAKQTLALALLAEARGAIDRRDFAHAAGWLEAADGIAAASNVENARQLLSAARKQADTDAWDQLLKTAQERLQQDRLIEPANDSAKYYLTTLRDVNPGNAGLAPALQDLGVRLAAKARRALTLQQYDAARSWLEEAAAVGFSSADLSAALRETEAAANQQHFLANVIGASELTLVKSVTPIYPKKAEQARTEGWVELDFTVAEGGEVKDIAVHAANPLSVFDGAAIGALSQWRYKPVIRDSKPSAQRARIRIRFALKD